MAIVMVGDMSKFAPPTIADVISPDRMASQAMCKHIRADEQAVLTVILLCV
jgi:hypothetical protein